MPDMKKMIANSANTTTVTTTARFEYVGSKVDWDAFAATTETRRAEAPPKTNSNGSNHSFNPDMPPRLNHLRNEKSRRP